MVGTLRDTLDDWLLGLRRSLDLVRRPSASWRALAAGRNTIGRGYEQAAKLFLWSGESVGTPADVPVVVTRIDGSGDVTVRVRRGARLTPELTARHAEDVNSILQPIRDAAAQARAWHAVVSALPLLAGGVSSLVAFISGFGSLPGFAIPLLAGPLVSATTTIGFRLLVRRIGRRVRAELIGG